jgi:uncharacterized membrane protein YjfL (UPF0719 family)
MIVKFEVTAFEDLAKTAAFVALYFVLFLLAKWFKDFLTPYKLNIELTQKDNLAVALTMSGYYLATVAIFIGALVGPSSGFVEDFMLVGWYSILGLIFLNVSRYINDKVILHKFSNAKQLIDEHNSAIGAVQFGTYIATGLIAGAAVAGTGGGVITAVVFFILGQISLLLFSVIYDFFTPYSIHEELEKKNIAAGAALGGTIIALGIIVMNGVSGDFIGWKDNITRLITVNVMAFIFLPLIRFFMDKLIIPGSDLNHEIVKDKNLGAGLLEATVSISFSIVLASLL